MTPETYFYDPVHGHGLVHDPFKAIVAPRIIGWISSRSKQGNDNLAPYSFFGAFSAKPYVIGFSSEGYKDSIRNVRETGEFVWNMCDQSLAAKMNITATSVSARIDEFDLSGIERGACKNVNVSRVVAAPAALECKLLRIVRLHDLSGGEINNWIAFGQVVGVHIRGDCLKSGLFDLQAAAPVLRAGYRGDYALMGEMFEMIRP